MGKIHSRIIHFEDFPYSVDDPNAKPKFIFNGMFPQGIGTPDKSADEIQKVLHGYGHKEDFSGVGCQWHFSRNISACEFSIYDDPGIKCDKCNGIICKHHAYFTIRKEFGKRHTRYREISRTCRGFCESNEEFQNRLEKWRRSFHEIHYLS